MTQTNDPIHKRLAVYADEELGCTFVGISNDKEVFISFIGEYTDEFESDTKSKIKDHFGDEVSQVATVVSVPIEEVTRMVDGLNQTIKELDAEEEKPKTELLNIGSF